MKKKTKPQFKLFHGSCLKVMQRMPDNCVDSIVTDPPYELGFMGKKWDASGIAYNVKMWREALRVLKPGGHLLAFSGSRTYHRMTCAIEDAGFEIRDQIMWLYGSGFPKSMNLSKALTKKGNVAAAALWNGWGTALKPAHEPICVARKPLLKGRTLLDNVLVHDVGALNIESCRVPAGSAAAGRWPANIIHDGSDDVVNAFPASKGSGGARVLKRGKRAEGDGWAMADQAGVLRDAGTGSAARFFYCAKASRADRNEGMVDPGPQFKHGATLRKIESKADAGKLKSNIHPTVKPVELMIYLCKLVTPPGGKILDPFLGSGSTGKAAVRSGFRFLGIDITPEYIEIATKRIQHEVDQHLLRIQAKKNGTAVSKPVPSSKSKPKSKKWIGVQAPK